MWKTTNYKGEAVTWYSEEEYEALRDNSVFNDPYFKGLMVEQILELAKKSIRITTENRRLEDKLEKVKFKIKDLKNDLCDNCSWRNSDNCDPIHSGYVCSDLLEMLDFIEDDK